MSDDEEDVCPLCAEEFDTTDKGFFPCPCEYQICLWCFDKLKGAADGGRCPACRKYYEEKNFTYLKPEEEMFKKEAAKKKKEASKKKESMPSSVHPSASSYSPAVLNEMRIVQRNLVYVIGLAPYLAVEEALRKNEYFGQYGKIIKVVINRANVEANGPHASASAYLTFDRKADALQCIMCIDGFQLDERMLRASFGTTKYCNFYLVGKPCTNPECLYLHHVGEDQDCFSLEQMQNNKKYFREYTHPGPGPRAPFVVEGPTKLPPPQPRSEKVVRIVTESKVVTDPNAPKIWGAPGTGVAILKAAVNVNNNNNNSNNSLATSTSDSQPLENNAEKDNLVDLLIEKKMISPSKNNSFEHRENIVSPPPGITGSESVSSSLTQSPIVLSSEATESSKPTPHQAAEEEVSILTAIEESKIDLLFLNSSTDPNLLDPVLHLASLLGLKVNFKSSRKESRFSFAQNRVSSSSSLNNNFIWSAASFFNSNSKEEKETEEKIGEELQGKKGGVVVPKKGAAQNKNKKFKKIE